MRVPQTPAPCHDVVAYSGMPCGSTVTPLWTTHRVIGQAARKPAISPTWARNQKTGLLGRNGGFGKKTWSVSANQMNTANSKTDMDTRSALAKIIIVARILSTPLRAVAEYRNATPMATAKK